MLAWNVQCALAFVGDPATYAASFELTGAPGSAAVRGVGLLFLMWNIPYLVALWDPLKQRVSLYEALAMQTVGLVGETLILLGLPVGYAVLRGSIGRFVVFDALGLAALGALAGWSAPLALLVAAYAALVLALSMVVAAGSSWALLWRLPFVIAAQQLGYGIGSLVGHWDAWRHGQGRERFARLTR